MNKEEQFKNQRSDKFSLVLNDNIEGLPLLKSSRNIYEKLMFDDNKQILFIAVIKHDQDIDEVTKLKKTIHYHLVLVFNGIYRVGTIMNWLIEKFHLNENQISIQKCNSIAMQSRYLIHLDDFDKTRYNLWDIETNDHSLLERYFKLTFIKDIHELITSVRAYNYNLEEIMDNIANYDKYRKYVIDLINDHRRKF